MLVGAEMLATDVVHVPIWVSLVLIGVTIRGSLLLSLRRSGGRGTGPALSADAGLDVADD